MWSGYAKQPQSKGTLYNVSFKILHFCAASCNSQAPGPTPFFILYYVSHHSLLRGWPPFKNCTFVRFAFKCELNISPPSLVVTLEEEWGGWEERARGDFHYMSSHSLNSGVKRGHSEHVAGKLPTSVPLLLTSASKTCIDFDASHLWTICDLLSSLQRKKRLSRN